MNNLTSKYFLIYFIIINFIGFTSMYMDKQKAINNQYRISENTLIFLGVLGGSIGSLIGMYKFRHKTKKIKFTFGFPIIIFIQFLFFIYIF